VDAESDDALADDEWPVDALLRVTNAAAEGNAERAKKRWILIVLTSACCSVI
jgi:hypothetical protein